MAKKKSGLHPMAVVGVMRELSNVAESQGPVVVGGARELANLLRRELGRGGALGAVRDGDVDGASVYVHVLAAEPTEDDERAVRTARRRRVPTVAVLTAPSIEARLPFVLATDVVRVPVGSGFPIDEIARAIARTVGEDATELAARLPVLRDAVCDELIARFSRTNGIAGAAVFIPGADMPVITLNQLRLVLRIAAAHGVSVDRERVPEVLTVLGSGFALRAVARQLVAAVPVAGWAAKGAIAYAGTSALGEAARTYFRARAASGRAGAAAATS